MPEDDAAGSPSLMASGMVYHITTAEELSNVRNDLDGTYYLDNDVDLSELGEWIPIGTSTSSGQCFTGIFDGQGNTISGLTMSGESYTYSGLFGVVSSGTIKNVNIDVNIYDAKTAGALVGYLNNGTVDCCSSTGSVAGENDVGGLVGYAYSNATIKNSYSMASATSTSTTESDGCGGLVGEMYSYDSIAKVTTSYAAGKVTKTGTSGVGGLVGYAHSRYGSYAIVASYYCSSTTKMGDEKKGFGLTSTYMKKQETYANWDFDNIWAISSSVNDGYPYLKLTDDYQTVTLSGTGAASNPYIVTTEAELAAIARGEITNSFTAYYQLGNDITLSSDYWTPIGGIGLGSFSGTFDGAGYTIYNVNIAFPAYSYEGLFGSVTGTVKNLNVEADISDAKIAGALVGYLNGGTVDCCSSTGSVAGVNDIGGLVGYAYSNATIKNSYSMASATSTSTTESDGCGGLVGEMYSYDSIAEIMTSYAAGKVTKTGTSGVGGLVGYVHSRYGSYAIVASYYCSSTTKMGDEQKGFGLTSTYMKKQGTYANWDFNNIWAIDSSVNSGYPYLKLTGEYNTFVMEGSGTSRDPYIVTTEAELAAIARGEITNSFTAYYQLGNDIMLSSDYWTPIGGIGLGDFSGTFDGDGYAIYNVNIAFPAYSYEGLFGSVTGTVKNLNIEADISDAKTAGALVGYLNGGTVDCCSSTGSVAGANDIGGLVGYAYSNATIKNSYSMASAASTSTTESDGCGGLAGEMYSYDSIAKVTTSYAAGKVTKTGTSGVGGLVGYVHSRYGSYAIVASYYCSSTTLQSDTQKGFFVESDVMKSQDTFANWDFDNIWTIKSSVNDGYPYLKLAGDYNTFEMEGSGTSRDPYIVTTEAELAAIARGEITNNFTSYYQLGNDIALSSDYWTPIGGIGLGDFSGTFDGDGHTISNVKICCPAYSYSGLFGAVTGTVKNLNVTSDISGVTTVGALVGYLNGGSVEQCSSSGDVNGSGDVGGLVGYAYYGVSISNCFSRTNATNTSATESNGCGGLVGELYSYDATATIAYSYATGTVMKNSTSGLGGIVGYAHSRYGATEVTSSYCDNYDDGATGKGIYTTTEAMKTQSTYTDWDFEDVWALASNVNDGYPYLINVASEAEPISVTALDLSKTELSLTEGKTATIRAIITPSNATNQTITWTSSNSKVASVEDGLVTGVSQGTAVIFAITEDGGYSAMCTVTVTEAVEEASVYEITALSLLSESGEALTEAPQNSGFIVNVSIQKNEERDARDYLFVAVYDVNGALLSLDYVVADFAENYTYDIGFHIQAQSSQIGSVKAFVWDSFKGMEVLAESKKL